MTRISSPISHNGQLWLWDEPLGNHGHVRTILGAYTEELTAKLFGGVRHRTDSRCDYCPDVSVGGTTYLECKCMGRSKQTWVYTGRFDRDVIFAFAHPLMYVIWHHGTHSKQAGTVGELRQLFVESLKAVYVLPFSSVVAIAQVAGTTKTNTKYYGGCTRGPSQLANYGMAYRMPLRHIEANPHYKLEILRNVEEATPQAGSFALAYDPEIIPGRVFRGGWGPGAPTDDRGACVNHGLAQHRP